MPRERDKRWFIVIQGTRSDETGEVELGSKLHLLYPGTSPHSRLHSEVIAKGDVHPIVEGWDRVDKIIKSLPAGGAKTVVEVREIGPPLRRLTYEMTVNDADLRESGDEQGQEQETAEPS